MITRFKLFESGNNKYQEIDEEEFFNLLNTNCKNFSLDNDPLYRGDMKDFQFMLHTPEERNTRGISYVDFFKEKEKDTEKYPVVRKNSSMGVGGGNPEKMKSMAGVLGGDWDDDGNVYRVIPFDNSKMVFCPVVDLNMLEYLGKMKNVVDENFIMVEYTKNFKVPSDELKQIAKRLLRNKFNINAVSAFEFFISSPCLLINIENESLLNEKF